MDIAEKGGRLISLHISKRYRKQFYFNLKIGHIKGRSWLPKLSILWERPELGPSSLIPFFFGFQNLLAINKVGIASRDRPFQPGIDQDDLSPGDVI